MNYIFLIENFLRTFWSQNETYWMNKNVRNNKNNKTVTRTSNRMNGISSADGWGETRGEHCFHSFGFSPL